MIQTKIYFASKRHHADKLKATRRDGFHYNCRWLETANLAETAAKPASHWLEENFADIKEADFVVVYAEPGEVLKTALLEAGWAMAWGKPVIVVGDHDSYRPWRGCASRVRMVPSLELALDSIERRVKPREVSVSRQPASNTVTSESHVSQ